MLAPKGGSGIWAASCSSLMAVDLRTSAPVVVASTSHSVEALRRAKITSICTPTLTYDDPLVAMATTDVVEYYDARYPSVPLHTWTHRRGFDRTLSLVPLGTAEHAMTCLSSQRNRLRALYDVRQEKTHLSFAMPSMLHASSLLAHEPASPAPPCFVDMTTLPGWGDWAPAHHGHVLQLEQTMRGALYAQWLGPEHDEDRDSRSAASHVRWSLQAQRNEKEACGTHDAGPFGELETTHVDFRALYKGVSRSLTTATILGWLGTDTPEALGHALPERLAALNAAPAELTRVPHTLYVYIAHTDWIVCTAAAKIRIALARRTCTRVPRGMALRCWHRRPVGTRSSAYGPPIRPRTSRPWSMRLRPGPHAICSRGSRRGTALCLTH